MTPRRSSIPPLDASHLRTAIPLADDVEGRAAQRRMEPARRGTPRREIAAGAPRPASALAYVFEQDGRLVLPLTVRRPDLPEHKGQVSLPGGRPLPAESSWATALREAEEEIGLVVPAVEPLGTLAPVWIPVTHTELLVHVATGPDPGALVPCPREVERIELVALDDLADPNRHAHRTITIDGRTLDVPYFDVNGLFLWGATAMGLCDLVTRLERARALTT